MRAGYKNGRAGGCAFPIMASVFLESVLNKENAAKSEKRPSVTLTFAQSIDAKIAGKDGQQLILSGKESMVMTHWYALLDV